MSYSKSKAQKKREKKQKMHEEWRSKLESIGVDPDVDDLDGILRDIAYGEADELEDEFRETGYHSGSP